MLPRINGNGSIWVYIPFDIFLCAHVFLIHICVCVLLHGIMFAFQLVACSGVISLPLLLKQTTTKKKNTKNPIIAVCLIIRDLL